MRAITAATMIAATMTAGTMTAGTMNVTLNSNIRIGAIVLPLILFAILQLHACSAQANTEATSENRAASNFHSNKLSVKTEAPWGGYVRPENYSEIKILVSSEAGGNLDISLQNAQTTYLIHEQVNANSSKAISQQVFVHDSPHFTLRVNFNGERAYRGQFSFKLIRHNQPLIANTTTLSLPALQLPEHDFTVINAPPTSLPVHEFSYNNVNALVLDTSQLISLNREQMLALTRYNSDCGTLILQTHARSSSPFYDSKNKCSNENIIPLDFTAMSVMPSLARQLSAYDNQVFQPLNITAVASPETSNFQYFIILMFSAYIVVLILQVMLSVRGIFIALTPMTFTLILILISTNATAIHSIYSWIEHDSAPHASNEQTSLLSALGTGRGIHQLVFPRTLGIPVTNSKITIENSLSMPDNLILHFPVQLFSLSRFTFQSRLQIDPPEFNVDRHSKSIKATRQYPAKYALIDDKIFENVDMKSEWQIQDNELVKFTNLPVLQMLSKHKLRNHRKPSGAAILLPYSLHDAGLIESSVNSAGWLLINSYDK